jgi:serine/threonine protein kinase
VLHRSFHQNYRLGKALGKGAFSVVHEATRLSSNDRSGGGNDSVDDESPPSPPPAEGYAVKIVERSRLTAAGVARFRDEVRILAELRWHDNIVHLHEVYKSRRHFFVVTEIMSGGELFDRLCEKQTYSEMDARNVCRVVFGAVAYCHGRRIAHRDVKPENLLLGDAGDDAAIKVADFGFARKVARPNSLTTRCGSPQYTAPEIIKYRPYDQRVDNWSLGVIVYTVLGGYPPFYESTIHMTFQQIVQAHFTFHHEYWDGISPDAKNLIRRLLTVDPDKRMTAEEALQHPWMTGRTSGNDLDLTRKNISANLKKFKQFNAERKQQRSAANAKTVSYYWLLTRR